MDSSEVCRRFNLEKTKFMDEIASIQDSYISSNFSFKKGDVVSVIKNRRFNRNAPPILVLINSIYFDNDGNLFDERIYRNPGIIISGHRVDNDGYDLTYFKDSDQRISDMFIPDDIVEITSIIPRRIKRPN